jgi:hypothetical protein
MRSPAFTRSARAWVAGGHGTVASKVGAILDGEAFDDVGACGLVIGVSQDE